MPTDLTPADLARMEREADEWPDFSPHDAKELIAALRRAWADRDEARGRGRTMIASEHEQYPPIDDEELARLLATARKRKGDSWRDVARLCTAVQEARGLARSFRYALREEFGGLCPNCRAAIEDDEPHAPGCWWKDSDAALAAWTGENQDA